VRGLPLPIYKPGCGMAHFMEKRRSQAGRIVHDLLRQYDLCGLDGSDIRVKNIIKKVFILVSTVLSLS
jgi:hypothetical protein